MKFSERLNNMWEKVSTAVVRPVKKYVPAAMILFGSFGSAKAAPKETSDFKSNANTTIVTGKTKGVAKSSKFTFNNVRYDAKTMHVEDINYLFMSGNKFNAVYGGNSIETAKAYGPMLTKMEDLKNFINKNSEKYADLHEVIQKHGIRSQAFENAWMKYDVDGKRQEMTKDIIEYFWDNVYQPVFDANAKIGYPEINKENYNKPETFGYVASVISCLGQSSRQTTGIYKEAMQVAKEKFGDKANLDNFVDASYDIRHQRWGLAKRYFGDDNKSGEKYMNQKVREVMAQMGRGDREGSIIDFDGARLVDNTRAVEKTDAIKVETTDSLEKMELYRVERDNTIKLNPENKSLLQGLLQRASLSADVADLSQDEMNKFLRDFNTTFSSPEQLEAERQKTQEEVEKLREKADEISYDNYGFMGKKIKIDYEEMARNPEIIGHYYESGRNPIIKDKKKIQNTTAMGLYQFNMSNTMKVLADKFADEFPLLKQAKDNHGGSVRTADYENAWKFYSLGDNREKFEKRQLKLMFDQVKGANYKNSFDWMTKHCGAPEITLENYNNPEVCVYTGAMMSLVNQSPRQSTRFMKLAYERVKNKSKTADVDWNQVGVVVNDIKAEKWGKRKSLYRRYKGTKYNLGEKQMCEHLIRYIKEMPKLRAQIAEKERAIQYIDYALNSIKKNSWDYIASNDATDKESRTQAIQANKDKFQKIKIHARNMKEWHKAKQMAKRNDNVEILTGQDYALHRGNTNTNTNTNSNINGNSGNHRA